jgi:hypothetical protein
MLDEYQDLIDELLGTPAVVRALFETFGEAPSSDSVALVLALQERDKAVLDRLQRITRQASAHLTELPALPEEVAAAPVPADLTTFLSAFETSRGDLVSLLMNLTLRDWEKTGTHDVSGETTLAEEVEQHVEFDEAVRARLSSRGRP